MKTAIIISGDPRTFKDCFHSMRANILSQNDCDIFLHLYDGPNVNEVLDTYNPVKHIIEDRNKIFIDVPQSCYQNKPTETDPIGVFCQWRNIKQSFNLIDKKYDCVLKTRYDIKYTNPLNVCDFEMGNLNVPLGGDWRGGLFDMMAFGSFSVMEHYCSLFENLHKYSALGVPCHSEIMNSVHNATSKINRFEYTVLLRRQFDRGYIEDRVFTLR